MTNKTMKKTVDDRLDSLRSMTEALQLCSLGYDSEIIRSTIPDLSIKFLRDNCQPTRKRLIREKPKGLFSNESSYRDKRRLIFAAVFRYLESAGMVQQLHKQLPEKMSSRPVFKLKIDHDNSPRADRLQLGETIQIDLLSLAFAHKMVLDDFIQSDKYKDTVPNLREVFYVLLGILKGDIFIEKCQCGKDILVQNAHTRGKDGNFNRNFYICPWCENKRDNRMVSNYREKLEECLSLHENWVGERAGGDTDE